MHFIPFIRLIGWRPEYGYFAKQAGFTVKTSASLAALWQVVNQIGGKERYFFGNILWQTRALMDRAIGHSGKLQCIGVGTGRRVSLYLRLIPTVENIVNRDLNLTGFGSV